MEELQNELKSVTLERDSIAQKLAEAESKHKQAVDLRDEEIRFLREEIRLLKHKMFGPSSQALTPEEQLALFEADEVDETVVEDSVEKEQIVYERDKPKKRKDFSKLEQRDEVCDVADEDKQCACGETKSKIGEEVSQRVEYVPATATLVRTIRPKYACQACQGVETKGPTVAIADLPPALLPKSVVTPSLLSHILTTKMADGVPFYRQEKQLDRIGLELHRGTMASWVIKIAEKCAPILEKLVEMTKKRTAINLDETTVQVLREKDRKATKKSYMWVMRAGPPLVTSSEIRAKEPEIVLFHYQQTRSSSYAQKLVEGFQGYVQTDDYGGYNFLHGKDAEGKWRHVYCLAHIRRKFHDALKIAKGSKPLGKGVADEAIHDIAEIYKAEWKCREQAQDSQDLIEKRTNKVLPKLDKLIHKISGFQSQIPPKSKLGKAIAYALKTLPRIKDYAQSEHLTLDNNLIENKIRPFAVGRKNWLFSTTPEGAHALATWYSLVETAKANGWKANQYLLHLLEGIRVNQPIDLLLPTNSP